MAQKIAICLLSLLLLDAASAQRPYRGFDRNIYPGDAALPALARSFRFTGYWLNAPPGAQQNTWTGKRPILRRHGFGFLVLFNGRVYAELHAAELKTAQPGTASAALGVQDGKTALAAATREGFPRNIRIFLDMEEGGRLLPEQAVYLFAWADTVRAAGARAGVYCSAIDVPDGNNTISTARDIVERENARSKDLFKNQSAKRQQKLTLWIANDQCPPSPGCSLAAPPLFSASSSAIAASTVAWQYAQSPRRAQFSSGCPANHAPDGNCYAPGLAPNIFVDLNVSNSPDPSEAP